MNNTFIDHSELKRKVEAGEPFDVNCVADPSGWLLVICCGDVRLTLLATRNKRARVFKKFETLAAYALDLGIQQLHVDLAQYNVDGFVSYERPDASLRLRTANKVLKLAGSASGS